MQITEHTSPAAQRAAMLEARLQRFGVHRASHQARPSTCPTGWPSLDAVLPGRGYPLGAVTEFLVEQPGSGELSLLLAALKPRLAADPTSRLVFVNPPYQLNAPALDTARVDRSRVPVVQCASTAERVWSIEQLAHAGGFAAFVLWDSDIDTPGLRRLQLAAEKAACPIFVYRDIRCARQRSPAALRLAVTCRGGYQRLEVLKCRGPAGAHLRGLRRGRDQSWCWPGLGVSRLQPRPADNELFAGFTHVPQKQTPTGRQRASLGRVTTPDMTHSRTQ